MFTDTSRNWLRSHPTSSWLRAAPQPWHRCCRRRKPFRSLVQHSVSVMLLLLSALLFGFGLLLLSVGLAVWLIGLALQVVLGLLQLVLLFVCWVQQRTAQADPPPEATPMQVNLLNINIELVVGRHMGD